MNSQEYRNLSEAYLDVYENEQLDEMPYRVVTKNNDGEEVYVGGKYATRKTARTKVDKEDEKVGGYRHSIRKVDEATAMAKRGLNEPAIRQQIASKTGGGSFADKATKLADRETYGDKKKKEGRENLARKQRGDFRDTTSSNPGLHGYAYKATTDADKEKKAARGAQRGRLTPNERKQLNREELSLDERVLGQDPEMRRARTKDEKRLPPSSGKEYAANQKKSISYMDKLTKNNKIIPGMAHESYDLFDYIMEYLMTEGYADTNENALVIMANMSEDWRESIVEGPNYDKNRQRAAKRAAERNEARKRGQTGSVPGIGYVSPRPERETYRDATGVERHTSGARMPKKD